jgi:hypothetical protein
MSWIIFYQPANNNSDTLTYRVRDTRGGVQTASILIAVGNPAGQAQAITASGGQVSVNFAGIPGFPYRVERAEDAGFTVNVTTLATTNAPAAGVFLFTDPAPPMPQAYYRLRYNP